MSDIEQKTPNKTGASGAAWTDAEKMAYLIVLSDNGGNVESKVANAPIPHGRSIVSCRKLLVRLKKQYGAEIGNIKNGQPIGTGGDGDADTMPEKKTPRKRKTKAEKEAEADEEMEGLPKKKAASRKTKEGSDGADAEASPKKKATPHKKKEMVEAEVEAEDEM